MIKDAAVGGLLKAAGVGHRGDLGFVNELFVKNQRDGTPHLSTPYTVRERGQKLEARR